jgi:hypothetical protein
MIRTASIFAFALLTVAGCAAETAVDDTDLGAQGFQCLAEPTCEVGDRGVASPFECDRAGVCYSTERCGKTLWCTGPSRPTCLAVPSCDAGDVPAKTPADCARPGVECYDRELCGQALRCVKKTGNGPICLAMPSCDPGDRVARSKAECRRAGKRCYPATRCGKTIDCIDVR